MRNDIKNSFHTVTSDHLLNVSRKGAARKPQLRADDIGDDALAILCVVQRHGKMTDSKIISMTQKLTQHCLLQVIDKMFPNGVTTKNFEPRQYEFQEKYRDMLRGYAQGDFNLPAETKVAAPARAP